MSVLTTEAQSKVKVYTGSTGTYNPQLGAFVAWPYEKTQSEDAFAYSPGSEPQSRHKKPHIYHPSSVCNFFFGKERGRGM